MTCLVKILLTQRLPSLTYLIRSAYAIVIIMISIESCCCVSTSEDHILNGVEVLCRGVSCFRRPVRRSPEADVVKTVGIIAKFSQGLLAHMFRVI